MNLHPFPLCLERLARAKFAFTTRLVSRETFAGFVTNVVPEPGDLVLARVTGVGHHERLELPGGRKSRLFRDDEVIVVYGHRYAPDQFEAEVPPDLEACHLVAAGGVAARLISRHSAARAPTELEPVGLLVDREEERINVRRFGLNEADDTELPLVVAVLGTAMNSGKTTAAAHLVRGLCGAGVGVGATKVTGTGAGGDLWLLADAGANPVVDFTHAGLATTYRCPALEVERAFRLLTSHLAAAGVDAIVLEVADGLLQPETAGLVRSRCFADRVDAVILAAGDAMGAAAGVDRLREWGVPAMALTGVVSSSPLGAREAQAATGLPVFSPDQLAEGGEVVLAMLGCSEVRRVVAA